MTIVGGVMLELLLADSILHLMNINKTLGTLPLPAVYQLAPDTRDGFVLLKAHIENLNGVIDQFLEQDAES